MEVGGGGHQRVLCRRQPFHRSGCSASRRGAFVEDGPALEGRLPFETGGVEPVEREDVVAAAGAPEGVVGVPYHLDPRPGIGAVDAKRQAIESPRRPTLPVDDRPATVDVEPAGVRLAGPRERRIPLGNGWPACDGVGEGAALVVRQHLGRQELSGGAGVRAIEPPSGRQGIVRCGHRNAGDDAQQEPGDEHHARASYHGGRGWSKQNTPDGVVRATC